MNRVALPESQLFYARAIRWCVQFAQTPGRLEQFLRYTLVSAMSLGLDLAVFGALISATVIAPALAGALSNTAGLFLHYFLSVNMVFDRSQTGKTSRQLITEYMLTGLLGFAITASAIFVVTDLVGLPAWAGKGAGVAANFIAIYLVRAGFVFAPAKSG